MLGYGWGNRWALARGTWLGRAQPLVFKKLNKNPLSKPTTLASQFHITLPNDN
jgi:hypothetical protein